MIFYFLTNGAFGEAWTPYSWLQFSGMIVRPRYNYVRASVTNGVVVVVLTQKNARGYLLYRPHQDSGTFLKNGVDRSIMLVV